MRGAHVGVALRRSCGWAPILAALVFAVSWTAFCEDVIDITGVDVRVVQGSGSSSSLLNRAAVGDLLHIRAGVWNVSDQTVERVEIEFFFTEQVTGEHGRIGTQTVYEIVPGGEKRPVVTLDTRGFTPGVYRFTAALFDPDGSLRDDVVENNRYEQSTSEGTSMLAQGPGIAELSLATPFGTCQLARTVLVNPLWGTTTEMATGGIANRISLNVYNVGTDTLTNARSETGQPISVTVEYRNSPSDAWEPLGSYSPGAGGNTLTVQFPDIAPGGNTTVLLSELDYSPLAPLYRPTAEQQDTFSVLGQKAGTKDPLFLRVVLAAGLGESIASQEIYLPSKTSGTTVYSDRDLWTFPARSECGCTSGCDRFCTTIGPVRSGFLLFHVTSNGEDYQLNALDARSGNSIASWTTDTPIVTQPVVGFAEVQGVGEWIVFVGTGDGAVQSIVIRRTLQGAVTLEKRDAWDAPSGSVSSLDTSTGEPTAHLLLTNTAVGVDSLGEAALIVASANGVFFLDASSGEILSSYRTRDDLLVESDDFEGSAPLSVTLKPAYAGEMLWFSIDRYIVGLDGLSGNGCVFPANTRITTPLALWEPTGTLFFGAEFGTVYALDTNGVLVPGAEGEQSTLSCPAPDSINSSLRRIEGIALGLDGSRDGDDDIAVYAVDEAFTVWNVEYDPEGGFHHTTTGRGRRQVDATSDETANPGTVTPWTSTTVPALVWDAQNGVETVFYSGMFLFAREREGSTVTRPALYALNGDLTSVRTFTTWEEELEFVFTLEDATRPFLTPVWFDSEESLIVAVPGGYLYAFNGAFVSSGEN